MSVGTIHGVGLGPGDPDLMTVRAHRLLREARYVAYFRKAGRTGQARKIIKGLLRDDVVEYPMEYPVTTEIALTDPEYNRRLSGFYADCAAHLLKLAQSGKDVVVVSEGDPFFYGSFMHIYERVRDQVPVQVVPAVTGMSAAWSATGEPITWGDDILTVLMATLSEAELSKRMKSTDALVVMKIGRNIGKVCAALKAAGKFDDAWLVEYASMPEQTVQKLSAAQGRAVPYFSIIIVHGQGRRP
ncbi:precorrin-2 C(20)-methyltransferase [Lentibacter sp. XHP0401]|uniref:precorrin-2 C(20)-methyltransferase n=1 Tax=Lentibacter sp. XHP0401 TaxID=2984334 RepID=UPI0021E8D16D|nr:precorrin-2 C(20)-methyltransferase [Lentibacter sp. XHP0401]MCV2892045.1 precorrin-2 C(20)-methyltransferase [Lentibacter sp. XHP0401]